MNSQDDRSKKAAEILRQAEKMSGGKGAHPSGDFKALFPEEMGRTVEELRVHQIELEMQNEEFRRAQQELEATRGGDQRCTRNVPRHYRAKTGRRRNQPIER